jgi:hypothetical protein
MIHSLGIHRVLVNAPSVPVEELPGALSQQIETVKSCLAGS